MAGELWVVAVVGKSGNRWSRERWRVPWLMSACLSIDLHLMNLRRSLSAPSPSVSGCLDYPSRNWAVHHRFETWDTRDFVFALVFAFSIFDREEIGLEGALNGRFGGLICIFIILLSNLLVICTIEPFGTEWRRFVWTKKRRRRRRKGGETVISHVSKNVCCRKKKNNRACPLAAQINRTNLPVNIPDAIKMLILWEGGRGLKSLLYFKICGTLSSKDRHQCKINVHTCYTWRDQREPQFYARYLFFFLQKLDGDIHQEFRRFVPFKNRATGHGNALLFTDRSNERILAERKSLSSRCTSRRHGKKYNIIERSI